MMRFYLRKEKLQHSLGLLRFQVFISWPELSCHKRYCLSMTFFILTNLFFIKFPTVSKIKVFGDVTLALISAELQECNLHSHSVFLIHFLKSNVRTHWFHFEYICYTVNAYVSTSSSSLFYLKTWRLKGRKTYHLDKTVSGHNIG